ncbi:MAG: phosphoribosyltransferase [Oscillatoria sp. PMC 1068.18]|nr:phosphoribosyltransferase [Oscillatoria sp. PMC 1076.18]MEC4989520.1 phosphoribosyltransferase [Oscillatoria sp. PMC 1068.18]
MPDLYISWSEYHEKIENLAVKIYQSGWEFNQIVCIAKGGLRVGDILCRIYRQPLAIISASSYLGEENRIRGEITFSDHLSMTTKSLGSKVLLVDDLVDSGVSLRETINWLQQHCRAEIEEIRTAVIWYKDCSQIVPDYYVDYLPNNPWIHQPFESYELTTPAELAARNQSFALKD